MKKLLLLFTTLLINTSCITVSDNIAPEEEYATAKKWGGSVSAIYKIEQINSVFGTDTKLETSRRVQFIESAIMSTLKEYFDDVQLMNANFTNWPRHHETDHKINISISSRTEDSFVNVINALFHIYTFGIIPYTERHSETVRVDFVRNDITLKSSVKNEGYRLWSSLLFAFNSEGEAFSVKYIENQLRAALNEAHKKQL